MHVIAPVARVRAVVRVRAFGDADATNAAASQPRPKACPVCKGTGMKPCGQCEGTGKNREDLFGGRYKAGDACWLCSGKAKTMCGNCVDLTVRFEPLANAMLYNIK